MFLVMYICFLGKRTFVSTLKEKMVNKDFVSAQTHFSNKFYDLLLKEQ